MKNSLVKKLAAYSAIGGSGIITTMDADAQIMYTDIAPDTIVTHLHPYNLDLNNDGIVDFQFEAFKAFSASVWGVRIDDDEGPVINQVNGFTSSVISTYWVYPFVLSMNEPISASNQWQGIGFPREGGLLFYFSYPATYKGLWGGAVDKYIGLRITKDSSTYYGWARLDVPNFDSIVVKDYAYNTTAGQPILAGQTMPASLSGTFAANLGFAIFPNPATDVLTLQFHLQNFSNVIIELFDLQGKKIKTIAEGNFETGSHSVPFAGVGGAGVYLLQLKTNHGISTKKLVIE